MAWIAGADGCRSGWFRASYETETGALSFDAVRCASDLITRPASPYAYGFGGRVAGILPLGSRSRDGALFSFPGRFAPRLLARHAAGNERSMGHALRFDLSVRWSRPEVLAVDIPIGLTESGQRACDREARNLLGWPRRNSIFPAPVRAALAAQSREEASRITRNQDGRGVGCQAWGLYPKIGEIDDLLQSRKELRQIIREVHPEVCFWAWGGGQPMASAKKTPAGKAERLALAEGWLGRGVLDEARGTSPRSMVGDDDILDAIAALWSAARIFAGIAETLPASPVPDSTGLRMEIVY